jgi:hypothetical protein
MDENTPLQSNTSITESSPKTLIGLLRQEYQNAMHLIDTQSGEEIKSGHEMKGVMIFMTAGKKLQEIHEQLSTLYCILFRNQGLLESNNSERLKQLGHTMVVIKELVDEVIGKNPDGEEYSDEIKETTLIKEFNELGYRKKHWYFKEWFLVEIEYMLDTLSILIEPDFIPITVVDDSSPDKAIDRYIPPEVKLHVWRRDQGKCIECGSKEKLEYDHIIPISKGGSNTERNVQLLCQTCNRKKAAAIQ